MCGAVRGPAREGLNEHVTIFVYSACMFREIGAPTTFTGTVLNEREETRGVGHGHMATSTQSRNPTQYRRRTHVHWFAMMSTGTCAKATRVMTTIPLEHLPPSLLARIACHLGVRGTVVLSTVCRALATHIASVPPGLESLYGAARIEKYDNSWPRTNAFWAHWRDAGGVCDVDLIERVKRGHALHVHCALLAGADPTIGRAGATYFTEQVSIHNASSQGHVAIVRRLLLHPQVDPSALQQSSVRFAAANGHADVPRVLMADPRVDTTVRNDQALYWACMHGRVEALDVLLENPATNPSRVGNRALLVACEEGRTDVVERLLQDRRLVLDACEWMELRAFAHGRHGNAKLRAWCDAHVPYA